MMDTNMNISFLGDHSIIIEWQQQMDPDIHQQVMGVFYYLQALALPYVLDLIPAYASLTVVYDALLTDDISVQITQLIADIPAAAHVPSRLLEIPVCYDPSLGLDIVSMAAHKSLSVDDIIELHTKQVYTVYMLGFLPGFPYMGKVDERLATPRLKKPRLKVPAGSVGIAGAQTGIYSMTSPGGWNIIGKTPVPMFDPGRTTPCYCSPGDQIQFVQISIEDFHKMK
jgi:inhibitor of KinA